MERGGHRGRTTCRSPRTADRRPPVLDEERAARDGRWRPRRAASVPVHVESPPHVTRGGRPSWPPAPAWWRVDRWSLGALASSLDATRATRRESQLVWVAVRYALRSVM